jgi:hypothetical protein
MQRRFLVVKMDSNVHCQGDRTAGIDGWILPTRSGRRIMKTLLKLCIPLLALLTPGFGQEPKTALIKDTPAAESREQTVTTGSAKEPAPKVQPKALPPLSPTLGEIARAARAAHAAAAKAQMVLDPDADIITVTNPSEKTAAVTDATADPGPRAVPRM